MKNLQAESYSPLYHQLMTRIRADIEQGTYPIGSKIPPEITITEKGEGNENSGQK